jgi:hypothetical protein
MSDFDSANLLSDWNAVLGVAGSLTATTGGVTFSGVWAERADAFADMNDQLRNEKRFTVFTTTTELATIPALRQVVNRASVTYFVEAVRADAEGCGIEIDVKTVI